MSTSYSCPCCQTDFTPSVSAETAGKDSMQNMFDCPHCQSVLKWEQNTIKVIHKADPVEPLSLPNDTETPANPAEPLSLPNDTETPIVGDSESTPIQETPNEPIVESPHIAIQTAIDETDDNKFNFNESHPEEELKQTDTNLNRIPESTDEIESSSSSQANFNLSNEEELIPSSNTSENFSDIESYGNSEDTMDKGFLHYDITIKGIDSEKIEQQILGILEDPRFNWMAKEILSLQKDGVLILKKLNPVKAMCLISELSFLPVTLNWKQYMAIESQAETINEEQPLKGEPTDNPEENREE